MQVNFGDKVRFRFTPVTQQPGLAGQLGTIYGESTPSSSGVVVEGPCPGDFAVNVVVDGQPGSVWIDPEHVEFIDHGAGQEMKLGNKRFIRSQVSGLSSDELADGWVPRSHSGYEKFNWRSVTRFYVASPVCFVRLFR